MNECITSKDNFRLKEYSKLVSGKQARKKTGKFPLEGFRLCEEAMKSGVVVEYLLISESFAESHAEHMCEWEQKKIPVFVITNSLARKISDTSGPQGVFAVCKQPAPFAMERLFGLQKILCLYDIQDPGNMGTIIRSADAFGFEAIVLSSGCCDVFSPKVLRSTMGSLFHLPFYFADDMYEFEQSMKEHGLISAAAVVRNADLSLGSCNLPKIHLLYIGNEGNGLPEAFSPLCKYRITLSMKGKAESLNAAMAAGILMWEMTKQ